VGSNVEFRVILKPKLHRTRPVLPVFIKGSIAGVINEPETTKNEKIQKKNSSQLSDYANSSTSWYKNREKLIQEVHI